jgi:hypothetical protein
MEQSGGVRNEESSMADQSLMDITAQLAEPFPLECIELLPKGKFEKDGKTQCMGMPYADVRVYQDRLNALALGDWSTPPPISFAAGKKLMTYVTVIVCGIPHTDVGESSLDEENTGTEAWAQAFKRACSQFGLGRYLYDLDKAWVPYNVQRKQIDLNASELRNVIRQMYQKAGIPLPTVRGNASKTPPNAQQTAQPAASNGSANGHQPASEPRYRQLYQRGGKKGLWSSAKGFYAFCDATVGMMVTDENVKQLDASQLDKLEQAIAEEQPIAKAS